MALRTPDDDPSLNPGQIHSDETFNGLRKAEEDATAPGEPAADQEESILKQALGAWKTNIGEEKAVEEKKKNKRLRRSAAYLKVAKKKGPLTAIILTVIGGGLGIGGLLSPGLLIVNLKEVMVNKFNTQLTSMDIRTTKMLKSKTLGGVGICSSIVNIRCKYSSMSDYQIKKFKNAGIDIEFDPNEPKTLLNKRKITALNFDNNRITAPDLENNLNTNTKFRTAMKKGYNPLFAGFADKIGNKVLFRFGGKKAVVLEGSTDAEKLKSVQKETAAPLSTTEDIATPKKGDFDDEAAFRKAEAEAADATKAAKALTAEVAEISQTGLKAAAKETTDTLSSIIKITGPADMACTAYGTIRAVGFAAKVVRAAQLATFALIFLKMADQIKAGGNPNPDDVSYLGKVLTTEVPSNVLNSNGTNVQNADGTNMVVKKSATDSFGYKYAANGEVGIMSNTASQFLAGGGLTGTLIGVTSAINSVLGKHPNTVCKTLNNIFVQIGSATVGVAAAILSGGVEITVKMVAQAAFGVLIGVALTYLPALLKDIVAGVVVDDSTVGEPAGDAITSGSSGLMASLAAETNSPLTKEQAVTYQNLSNSVATKYAEEDQLAYGPFDASNRNTFMGSILTKLTPYLVNMSSLPNSLSSVSSLISNSLSSIAPTSKAATGLEYDLCQDGDYKDLGLAADPYCNLVYGVPVDALQNISPTDVLDKMAGQIDPITGEVASDSSSTSYETFLKNCINRTEPIGYTGSSFDIEAGKGCLINDSNPMNKYYYLYQIDQRVQQGMDGEDSTLVAAMETGLGTDISFYDGSNGINNNIASTPANNPLNTTTLLKQFSLSSDLSQSAATKNTISQTLDLTTLLKVPNVNYFDTNRYGL